RIENHLSPLWRELVHTLGDRQSTEFHLLSAFRPNIRRIGHLITRLSHLDHNPEFHRCPRQALGHLGGEKVRRPLRGLLGGKEFHFGFGDNAESTEQGFTLLVHQLERCNREVWLSGEARRNAVWPFDECLCCWMSRQKCSDRRRRGGAWAARNRSMD